MKTSRYHERAEQRVIALEGMLASIPNPSADDRRFIDDLIALERKSADEMDKIERDGQRKLRRLYFLAKVIDSIGGNDGKNLYYAIEFMLFVIVMAIVQAFR
jgi:hypothetical protein